MMVLSKILEAKLNDLINFLKDKKVIVAFSGGVDSSLLAYLSNEHAREALLITERSILYPDVEIEEAKRFADKYDINHVIMDRNPLHDDSFTLNPKNRCYICKTGLYSDIIKVKESRGFDIIVDGSNIDDLADYRPGMQALKELDIKTPYIELKISKLEIREMCKYYGLEVQSKPSMACYSSRIPYGEPINLEKLRLINEGEAFLRQAFNLNQLRVRLHEGPLARIEFLPEDLKKILTEDNLKLIKEKFKELGFCYVTVDVEGFRSGSMNEVLDL